MADFFYMGGYAFYVWTSYFVVLALLLWHYFAPLVRTRTLLRMMSLPRNHRNEVEKATHET